MRGLPGRAILGALILVLAGCDDCGPFDTPDPVALEQGVYTATSILNVFSTTGSDLEDHPLVGATGVSATVDRTAGLVTLRYTKDGESVTERWRIRP